MKLEEAACVLGVSIDTSVDNLKSTYRRLALHRHPDKVSKYCKFNIIPINEYYY